MLGCSVDDNALINEKTSLKESHIGPNVLVESKTRVSSSIVMENVTIKQRYFKLTKFCIYILCSKDSIFI